MGIKKFVQGLFSKKERQEMAKRTDRLDWERTLLALGAAYQKKNMNLHWK